MDSSSSLRTVDIASSASQQLPPRAVTYSAMLKPAVLAAKQQLSIISLRDWVAPKMILTLQQRKQLVDYFQLRFEGVPSLKLPFALNDVHPTQLNSCILAATKINVIKSLRNTPRKLQTPDMEILSNYFGPVSWIWEKPKSLLKVDNLLSKETRTAGKVVNPLKRPRTGWIAHWRLAYPLDTKRPHRQHMRVWKLKRDTKRIRHVFQKQSESSNNVLEQTSALLESTLGLTPLQMAPFVSSVVGLISGSVAISQKPSIASITTTICHATTLILNILDKKFSKSDVEFVTPLIESMLTENIPKVCDTLMSNPRNEDDTSSNHSSLPSFAVEGAVSITDDKVNCQTCGDPQLCRDIKNYISARKYHLQHPDRSRTSQKLRDALDDGFSILFDMILQDLDAKLICTRPNHDHTVRCVRWYCTSCGEYQNLDYAQDIINHTRIGMDYAKEYPTNEDLKRIIFQTYDSETMMKHDALLSPQYKGVLGLFLLVICTCIGAIGFKKLPDLRKLQDGMHFVNTILTKGVSNYKTICEWVGKLFCGEETILEATDDQLATAIEQCTHYAITPSFEIFTSPDSISGFAKAIRDGRELLKTTGKDGSNHLKIGLSRMLEQITKKYGQIETLLKSSTSRQVPTVILVYGKSAHGKTRALIELSTRINKDLHPDYNGTYIYNPSKYYPVYIGQKTMRVEEAFNNRDLREDKFAMDFNAIASNGFFNFEGAAVEEKFQPCRVEHLLMDTNCEPMDLVKKIPLEGEAVTGVINRMHIFRSKWNLPAEMLNNSRGSQGHREDFSHISFVPVRLKRFSNNVQVNQEKSFEDYTILKDGVPRSELSLSELQDFEKHLWIQNQKNAVTINEQIKAKFDAIDTLLPKAEKQNANHHLVCHIRGEQGLGKSTIVNSLLDKIKSLMPQMPIYKHAGDWDALKTTIRISGKRRGPMVFVFDDSFLVGQSFVSQESQYMDFYNTAPNGSLIIFVTNITTRTSWTPKVSWFEASTKPIYHQIFINQGMYRRVGMSGYYWHERTTIKVAPNNLEYIFTQNGLKNVSTGNMPTDRDFINGVIDSWRDRMMSNNNISISYTPNMPVPEGDETLMLRFPDVKTCMEMLSQPHHILRLSFKGRNNNEPSMFYIAPTLASTLSSVSFSEVSYTKNINTTTDVVDVVRFYAQLLRKYGVNIKAHVEITDAVVISLTGVIAKVYNYDSQSVVKRYLPSYNITTKCIEFCDTKSIEPFLHLPIDKYVQWIKQDDRAGPEYNSLHRDELELLSTFREYTPNNYESLYFYKHIAEVLKELRRRRLNAKLQIAVQFITKFVKSHFWSITLATGIVAIASWLALRDTRTQQTKQELFIFRSLCEKNGIKIPKEFHSTLKDLNLSQAEVEYFKKQTPTVSDKGDKPKWIIDPKALDYKFDDVGWADNYEVDYDADLDWNSKKQPRKQRIDKADWNEHPSNAVSEYFGTIRDNLVKVVGLNSGLIFGTNDYGVVFGIGISDRLILHPRHVIGTSKYVKIFDERAPEKQYKAKVIYNSKEKDLAISEIEDTSYPQFKNIISKFVTKKNPPKMGDRNVFCRIHKGRTEYHSGSVIRYYDTPYDHFAEDESEWVKDVVKIGHRADADLVSYFGDCGLPYLSSKLIGHSKPGILGFHIGGVDQFKTALTIYTIVFQEELIDICKSLKLKIEKQKGGIEVTIPSTRKDVKVQCTQEEYDLFSQWQVNYTSGAVPSHIPYTRHEVIATIPNAKCAPPKTDHFKSQYAMDVERAGIPMEKVPTKLPLELTDAEKQNLALDTAGNPCQLASQALLLEDAIPNIPEKIIQDCAEAMAPTFASQFGRFLRFASDDQVLSGVQAGETCELAGVFSPLETNSSIGPTLSHLFKVQKKSAAIGIDSEGKRYFLPNKVGNYLKNRFSYAKKDVKMGKRPFYLFKSCLKQERLPIKKAWKARLFEATDVLGTLLERYVFGLWASANKIVGYENSCRVGIDPITGFDKLAQWHLRKDNECFKFHFAGDFARFDKHCGKCTMEITIRKFQLAHCLYCQSKAIKHPENCTFCNAVRVVLEASGAFTINCVASTVVFQDQGHASGTYPTTSWGSDYNATGFYLAFRKLCYRVLNGNVSYQNFLKYVRMSTYGDDVFMSVHEDIVEAYNLVTISEFMKQYLGHDLDSADKDGNLVKYTSSLGDIKFMSRSFIRLDDSEIWIGALKKESISARLYWISKAMDSDEDFVEIFNTSYLEASLWEDSYFDKYRSLAINLMERYPNFRGKLYLYTRQELHRLLAKYVKGNCDFIKDLDLNKENIITLPDFNKLFKMSQQLEMDTLSQNSISKVNEALMNGIINGRRDAKDSVGHTWTVTITYLRKDESKNIPFSGVGGNLKEAKSRAYDKAWEFIDSQLITKKISIVDMLAPLNAPIIKTKDAFGDLSFETEEFYRWNHMNAQFVELPMPPESFPDSCKYYNTMYNLRHVETRNKFSRLYLDALWDFALQSHYYHNRHHPESQKNANGMDYVPTLELCCDLFASALRIKASPTDAFYLAQSWLFTPEGKLQKKFERADKTAILEYLQYVNDNGIVETHNIGSTAWRELAPTSDDWKCFMQMVNSLDAMSTHTFDEESIRMMAEKSPAIRNYLIETAEHINAVQALMQNHFLIEINHDHDKLISWMLVAYLYQWYFKNHWHTNPLFREIKFRKEMERAPTEMIAGSAAPNTFAVDKDGQVPTSILPGPHQSVDINTHVDSTGTPYTGSVALNTMPTQIQEDGVLLRYNYLDRMYAIPDQVQEYTITDQSKAGDFLFEITYDPETYTEKQKAWVQAHQYFYPDMNNKLITIGTETMIGTLCTILVPDRTEPPNFANDFSRAPHVKTTVNGVEVMDLKIPDVFHTGRIRKTKGDVNPWPALRVYIYEPLRNPRQPTQPFSITLKRESWFGPMMRVISPVAGVSLLPATSESDITRSRLALPFPPSEDKISLYVETKNRERLSSTNLIENFPALPGLDHPQYVYSSEISPANIAFSFPIALLAKPADLTTLECVIEAPIMFSGTFIAGSKEHFKTFLMNRVKTTKGNIENYQHQAIDNLYQSFDYTSKKTVESFVLTEALKSTYNDDEIGDYFENRSLNTAFRTSFDIDPSNAKNQPLVLHNLNDKDIHFEISCLTSANTCGYIVTFVPYFTSERNAFRPDIASFASRNADLNTFLKQAENEDFLPYLLYDIVDFNAGYQNKWLNLARITDSTFNRDVGNPVNINFNAKSFNTISDYLGVGVPHPGITRASRQVLGFAPIKLPPSVYQSNITIVNASFKSTTTDARYSSAKFLTNNFSIVKRLDIPQLPYDRYMQRFIAFLDQELYTRKVFRMSFAVRYQQTTIAHMIYDQDFGLAMYPTRNWVVYPNMDTNDLVITQINTDSPSIPETSTDDWKTYSAETRKFRKHIGFLATAAVGSIAGLGQGVAQAVDAERNRQFSREMAGIHYANNAKLLDQSGSNQLRNIQESGLQNLNAITKSGEINAKLQSGAFAQQTKMQSAAFQNQKQIMDQQLRNSGVMASPTLAASGKAPIASTSGSGPSVQLSGSSSDFGVSDA